VNTLVSTINNLRYGLLSKKTRLNSGVLFLILPNHCLYLKTLMSFAFRLHITIHFFLPFFGKHKVFKVSTWHSTHISIMYRFLFYVFMLWMQGWCQWSCYHFTSFKYYSFYPEFLKILSICNRACHSRLEWSKSCSLTVWTLEHVIFNWIIIIDILFIVVSMKYKDGILMVADMGGLLFNWLLSSFCKMLFI